MNNASSQPQFNSKDKNNEFATLLNIKKGIRQGQLLRMCDEGYVNLDFFGIIRQGNANNPYYLVQMISIYIAEMDSLLFRLNKIIQEKYFDFSLVGSLSRTVEMKSIRIGAERVRYSCTSLVQACDKRNKKEISEFLYYVNNEFQATKNKLRDFVKLEKEVVKMEVEQKKY